ncbi:MAG: hypothetical protein M3290_08830 [Actinomycetota bacterium]|nr:hypothetical protein [Actinomycetota bacterium]
MKKTIVSILALGLVAGALVMPAQAKKPKLVTRTVTVTYKGPGLGVATPKASGGICPLDTNADPSSQPQCIEIPTGANDKYIQVSIADAAGQKVGGYISQGDTDGDGISDLYGDFCGAHESAIPLAAPGVPVRISFYDGTCADGTTPSVITAGTITVKFSNHL